MDILHWCQFNPTSQVTATHLGPVQHGLHFADGIFKYVLNEISAPGGIRYPHHMIQSIYLVVTHIVITLVDAASVGPCTQCLGDALNVRNVCDHFDWPFSATLQHQICRVWRSAVCHIMTTPWYGNTFCITGPLCGECTDDSTKAQLCRPSMSPCSVNNVLDLELSRRLVGTPWWLCVVIVFQQLKYTQPLCKHIPI